MNCELKILVEMILSERNYICLGQYSKSRKETTYIIYEQMEEASISEYVFEQRCDEYRFECFVPMKRKICVRKGDLCSYMCNVFHFLEYP